MERQSRWRAALHDSRKMGRGPALTRCGVGPSLVALLVRVRMHREPRPTCIGIGATQPAFVPRPLGNRMRHPRQNTQCGAGPIVRFVFQIVRPTLGYDRPALGEIISWQRRVTKNVQPRRVFTFKLRSCVSPRFAGSKLAAFNASVTSACSLGTQFGCGIKASFSPDGARYHVATRCAIFQFRQYS